MVEYITRKQVEEIADAGVSAYQNEAVRTHRSHDVIRRGVVVKSFMTSGTEPTVCLVRDYDERHFLIMEDQLVLDK
jgi:hypothetical protein